MRYSLLIILALVFSVNLMAQPNVNKKDDQGRKTGKWIDYHPNGKVRYEGMFREGYEIGTFVYHNGTGQLTTKLMYSQKGEYADAIMYYSNGIVLAEGRFHNKKKDGAWKYYLKSPHNIKKEESYKDGMKHGVWKIYFSTGKLSSETHWENDKRQGDWNEFFENGNPRIQASFVNDELQGEYLVFYLGEVLAQEGNYVKGKMDGIWKAYNEKGGLIGKQRYSEGFLQEDATFKNGKLATYKSYSNTKFDDGFKDGE